MSRKIIVALLLASLAAGAADASPFSAKRFRKAVAVEAPGGTPLAPGAYQGAVGSWPQTAQPADIVNATSCAVPATYCRQVIAVWDMVPYQTITTSLKIGVVAYIAPTPAQHALGKTNPVDYVDISCDGGAKVRVETPSLNSDTGEIEYWTTLNPAAFADGLHECRFEAVPEEGRARVGQGATVNHYTTYSLFINTNHNGTLTKPTRIVAPDGIDDANCGDTLENACRQPWAARDSLRVAMGNDIGGGIICLMEGSYDWGKAGTQTSGSFLAATQYLRVEPCAGQNKMDVVFNDIKLNGSNQYKGLTTPKVKVSGVKVTKGLVYGGSIPHAFLEGNQTYSGTNGSTVVGQEIIWADDIYYDDGAVEDGGIMVGSKLQAGFVTNVEFHNAGRPMSYVKLARNIRVYEAGDDLCQSCHTILTYVTDYLDEGSHVGNHPDVTQIATFNLVNAVYRGIVCVTWCAAQNLFADGNAANLVDGLAYVNNSVTTRAPAAGGAVQYAWQGGRPWSNVYFLNSDLLGGGIKLDAASLVLNDINFAESTCNDSTWQMSVENAAEVTFLGANTGCQ